MADLRVGTVSDVDKETRKARVRFDDVGMVSGWLKILKNPPVVTALGTVSQTSSVAGSAESGSGNEENVADSAEITTDVSIDVTVETWLPAIGDVVLCAYGDGFNADGFVIGGL